MPRMVLDRGLQELQKDTIQAASHVSEKFITILTALTTGEYQALHYILEHCPCSEILPTRMEQQVFRLLILQQPLGKADIRFLTTMLAMNDLLNQIEETLTQIAQVLLQVALCTQDTNHLSASVSADSSKDQSNHHTDSITLHDLLLFGKTVEQFLCGACKAFTQRDAELARTIYNEIRQEMQGTLFSQKLIARQFLGGKGLAIQNDTSIAEHFTYSLWIVHKLVEIATSVKHMCKRIILLIEG